MILSMRGRNWEKIRSRWDKADGTRYLKSIDRHNQWIVSAFIATSGTFPSSLLLIFLFPLPPPTLSLRYRFFSPFFSCAPKHPFSLASFLRAYQNKPLALLPISLTHLSLTLRIVRQPFTPPLESGTCSSLPALGVASEGDDG